MDRAAVSVSAGSLPLRRGHVRDRQAAPVSMPLIPWDAPGPYRVAFTTRAGGVSGGPYDSLNLALLSDDASGERGGEPPPRLRGDRRGRRAAGDEPAGAHRARPPRGARRARRAGRRALDRRAGRADAQAHRRLRADRDRAAGRRRPALALVHAGWRGLAEGIVAAAAAALGRRRAGRRDRPRDRPVLLRGRSRGGASASTPT